KASNPEASDSFGIAVALSANAEVLAVSAPNEDSNAKGVNGNQADNSAKESGAVYVFARDGASWTQEAYLKASNAEAGDAFGWQLALSSNGSRLAVSSLFESGGVAGLDGDQSSNAAGKSGAVYLFERSS